MPRALLYNDGGFDVSPDGKTICACAEYWLPDDVDNAMDLLNKEELAYEAQMRQKESHEHLSSSISQPIQSDSTSSALSLPNTDGLCVVSAAFASLHAIKDTNNVATPEGSGSFREASEQSIQPSNLPPLTSIACDSPERITQAATIPRTPPVTNEGRFRSLSPPPPPGHRFGSQSMPSHQYSYSLGGALGGRGFANPPPLPPPPATPVGFTPRPHSLSVVVSNMPPSNSTQSNEMFSQGRYVPHVVMISLDTSEVHGDLKDESVTPTRVRPSCAVARGHRPRLGQLLEAHPLDANKAQAVTCVKFSPSTDFCLIGYGVREPMIEGGNNFHPVTAVYRIRGGMLHVSTMLSGDDDVNIARFHPDSGHSFVYGTKQGRVRVLSPRPWNFYTN